MESAVQYAADRDVVLVAGTGNDGGSVGYPAAYDQCIGVGSVDPNGSLAPSSSRGPNVDVVAPGVNVVSTVPTDQYQAMSGTSMASPVVAGVAALARAADPDASAAQIREWIRTTAVDVGLSSNQQGAGRVDAARVVQAAGGSGGGSGSGSGTTGGSGSGTGSGSGSDGGTSGGSPWGSDGGSSDGSVWGSGGDGGSNDGSVWGSGGDSGSSDGSVWGSGGDGGSSDGSVWGSGGDGGSSDGSEWGSDGGSGGAGWW